MCACRDAHANPNALADCHRDASPNRNANPNAHGDVERYPISNRATQSDPGSRHAHPYRHAARHGGTQPHAQRRADLREPDA